MAPDKADVTDYSYVVNFDALQPISLSLSSNPSIPSSIPDLTRRSFVSRVFPISTSSPEIRLLDLQRADHFEDPLVGTFRVISLDQDGYPYFTALSYVWGALQPTHGITIDLGVGLLSITRNCQDALRQIRHLCGNTTIWVDSICIDQISEAERCHQVSLMGDVYSRANKVYIWLGQETPGVRRALEYIEFAATFMYLPLDHGATDGAYQRLKFQLKVLPPVVTMKLMRNKWKLRALRNSYRLADLEELLRVAWFSRIWTFQEVVLSNDATILCGTATLDWSVFVRGFRCLDFLLTKPQGFWGSIDRVHDEKIFRSEKSSEETIELKEEVWEADAKAPPGFLALQRVLFLWMRVDRQGMRRNKNPSSENTCQSSILWHHRPYIGMWNRHLQISGASCTHTAVFMLSCASLISLTQLGQLPKKGFEIGIVAWLAVIAWLVLCMSCPLLLLMISFHPEGFSSDLNIKTSKHQVNDQLMSAVIETLGYRQAKEPKDMSYALYGVLRGFGVDLSELDYSKSKACIYHELCMDMLKFRPSAINLLIYVNNFQHGQGSLEMRTEKSPSWVPDWSKLEAKHFISLQPSSIPEVYCATKDGLAAMATLSGDRKAIFVSGHWKGAVSFYMGSLQIISDKAPSMLTRNDAMYRAIELFTGWVAAVTKLVFPEHKVIRRVYQRLGPCSDGPGQIQAYKPREKAVHPATVVHAFLTQRGSTAKMECDLLRFSRMYNIFAHAQKLQNRRSRQPEMTPQAAQEIFISLHSEGLLQFFVDMINGQARNSSSWFITTEGDLGCGTHSVMPGDRLALVAGVATPMVLRPLDSDNPDWFDSKYVAVCSAYVLGWMHGEVFEEELVRTIHII